MNIDIRNLQKWLNEEQEAPIDRQALARVLAMAEQPAQPQQEPVAWILKCGEQQELWWEKPPFGDAIALHTSPPAQRKPLTDEQIEIRIGYRLPPHGFDAIRQLIKENRNETLHGQDL